MIYSSICASLEHDLGRLHMNELLDAADRYEKDPSTLNKLDIITNAAV